MNLSIAPALPNAKKTDQKQYDYDHNVFTGLTHNLTAPALYKAITTRLLPAMDANPNVVKEVGVETAKYYIGVGNGIEYTQAIRPYLVVREYDEQKKLIGEICYEFKKSVMIENRGSKTSAETLTEVCSELELFVKTLGNFIENIGGASYHADRHTGYYSEKKAKEEISAIANALGIQAESGSSKSKSGNGLAGRGSYFDRQNQNAQTFNAETSSVENMDQLEQELQTSMLQ